MTDSAGRYYCILHERYTWTLVNKVDQMIDEGWQPLGAPYIRGDSTLQAMIRVDRSHINDVIKQVFEDDLPTIDTDTRS